ncbi:PAS domain-containing protein [Gelidibacter gilvus]|uniref:histidine kinase n=1 Tax=Gelidibacter gilvus TaxID=59602 RepID=A0A4Q0XGT1_9FLAO|nr:PAS domain-containing protein [Gelidibacter gilvus]RXJ49567.1 PAS domain S-box protein [Gelidibacter gilvus]
MATFNSFKSFKNVSIAHKLYSVVGIMAVLIIIELVTLFFAVNTFSSVRAFVGAEGLWSKSQKDAVYNLQQYYQSHKVEDIEAFYDFMKVPMGYHKTLVELSKTNPDLDLARQGLLEGRSHPDDVNGMIHLFRRFKDISYIRQAFNIWSEADATIFKLIPIAQKLQKEIDSVTPSKARLDTIIEELEPINEKLTKLEDDFSYTLGEGARWLENVILTILLVIAFTVGFSGLLLTYFVVRGITRGLKEIKMASERVAQRDFGVRAQVFSRDEIGDLANSFNTMTAELSNSIQKQIKADQDLESKIIFIQENERRIVSIMDALIKITQLDFSEKLAISDRGDELDSIAVGINTMSEEIESFIKETETNKKQIQKVNFNLAEAQKNAHIGSWEYYIEDKFFQWSDELYRIYGTNAASTEPTYENFFKLIHPDDHQLVKHAFEKAINNQQIFDIYHRIIREDGVERIVHKRINTVFDEDGVRILLGTAQDVTEEKQAERQLKQSEEKLKDAQHLAHIGSWDWDISKNKIEWSDELFRIFGLKPDNFEANFENYLKYIHPEDRENVNEIVQKAYQDHQPFDFLHRITLPSGQERTLHGRGKVYLNKKGHIFKMIGTAQDVTERIKVENKLNEYTNELEMKNKELAEFAYAASHDLQEPLRTIANFSKLLATKLETYPDKDLKHYMSLISGGANRMSIRIYDLLNYSRIGNDMSKSEIDCNIAVSQVLMDLSAIIGESGAEIIIEKLPVIVSGNLTMVFQNLILNAVKFRREGVQPVVHISAVDRAKDFLFKIKDNGIGIEKDYYDRIFIIFQRLHTRTAYEGTGIGLSLCKKIIELHGGTIWVESEFGKGSTFYFTIPKV